MDPHKQDNIRRDTKSNPIVSTPAEMHAAARHGTWIGTTAGQCPDKQQANLVMLPAHEAVEFAAFCTRNPTPCPIIEIMPPGDPRPAFSAPQADLRTDLPGYRVYRNGTLAEQCTDISDIWRKDLVSFLLGCSFTFEHALIDAGITPRNVSLSKKVSMYTSGLACESAGRFHGPMVVSMRPISQQQVNQVCELSSRYPHAHGAPVHVGNPDEIGIKDLSRPEYGDPVPIYPNEVPMFWGCGVTPQAVAVSSGVEFMITHEPGQMFVTDLPRDRNIRR